MSPKSINATLIFAALIIAQIYLIYSIGLTSDEPGYNLKSFNEIKYIFGLENVPLGLDVLHGNTFQIIGSTVSCISNPGTCFNLFSNLDNKDLFWSHYDGFLYDVRLVLVPLSLVGQLSLVSAARLVTKTNRFKIALFPVIVLYPIWISHSAFNFSDFIPLVGFSMLIFSLTALYSIHDFDEKKSIRIALNPWYLFASFFVIGGSRFPLIYIAFLSFLISFIPNVKYYFSIINLRKWIFPFILYFVVFTITNIRFVIDFPNSLLSSLGVSSNFEVGAGSRIFVFSKLYESASPPIWYIGFSNLARIPSIYLILTLLSFFYLSKLFSFRERRSYFFVTSIAIIIAFPLIYASLINSTSYDTARHFYFIHSVVLFLSLISLIQLLENLSLRASIFRRLTLGLFATLFSLLLADDLMLNTKTYVYRNELVRFLGVNVMESDYWASNRSELSRVVGYNSSPILIESQWFQDHARLFFRNYSYASDVGEAVLLSKVEKRLFLYRSSRPSDFKNVEINHPNCKIEYTSSSKMILQEIIDGRIYQC
jgi:hypothetical protein